MQISDTRPEIGRRARPVTVLDGRLSSGTAVVSVLLCSMTKVRPLCLHVLFLPSSSISSRTCDLVDGRAQEKDKVGARAPIRSFCDDIGGLLVSEPKWRAVQWCGASGRSGTGTVVGRCSDALWVPLV